MGKPLCLKPMKVSEEMINEWICSYLARQGGFVTRIAIGGFFKNGRMIKHKSTFIKRGIPDILYWRDGISYAFEVKTPKEHKRIKNNYTKYRDTPALKMSKQLVHFKEQILFIEALRKQGVVAGFVSSVTDVEGLLNEKA